MVVNFPRVVITLVVWISSRLCTLVHVDLIIYWVFVVYQPAVWRRLLLRYWLWLSVRIYRSTLFLLRFLSLHWGWLTTILSWLYLKALFLFLLFNWLLNSWNLVLWLLWWSFTVSSWFLLTVLALTIWLLALFRCRVPPWLSLIFCEFLLFVTLLRVRWFSSLRLS